MTLVALTQEPEVKVRLAMIGKWCSNLCPMLTIRSDGYDTQECCLLYEQDVERGPEHETPTGNFNGRLRCPACIAAHGGAE